MRKKTKMKKTAKSILWAAIILFSVTAKAQKSDLFPIKKEGKWGYINSSGELVVEAIYENACSFNEGYAVVCRKNKTWLIDTKGDETFVSGYVMSSTVHEGLFKITENGKVGYMDTKGEVVIEPRYLEGSDFFDGLASVKSAQNNMWGYINKKGEMEIPAVYDFAGNFNSGLAPVKIGNTGGYINGRGELVVNLKYVYLRNFSEGVAATWNYGSDVVYIDSKEEKVFVHQIFDPQNLPQGRWEMPVSDMKEDMVKAQDPNGLVGFFDGKGELEIPFQYQGGRDFSDGLAAVKSGTRWGFINKKGKMKIPARFENAGSFINGMAPVFKGGSEEDFRLGKSGVEMGYINPKGELVWQYSK